MAKKIVSLTMPGPSDRTVIVGQSGSGKTQFGAWLLSRMDYDHRPWIVLDYKNEEIFNAIEKAVYLDYSSAIPTKPGIYIIKVNSDEDISEMSDFLLRVHDAGKQGNGCGIYVDEGMVMGHHNRGYKACLTQGRSLQIPMIVLTQRPVGVSGWTFTEAKYWVVFDLMKKDDRKIVADYTPIRWDYQLKEYHSLYYQLQGKILKKLDPVPGFDQIVATFDERLPKQRRTL